MVNKHFIPEKSKNLITFYVKIKIYIIIDLNFLTIRYFIGVYLCSEFVF